MFGWHRSKHGDQVPLAVADALGVPLDGSGAERDVRHRLTSFLARRQMLLLVDNCEHVVDAAASLIDDILGPMPRRHSPGQDQLELPSPYPTRSR